MEDRKIIVPEKKIIINASLADRAIAFISALKHTKGEWHGKNFVLLPWQEKVVRAVFGTVKENGYRQYNTAYIEIQKNKARANSQLRSLYICWPVTANGVQRSTAVLQTGSRRPSSSTSRVRWSNSARR